jgi:hypothetical protein
MHAGFHLAVSTFSLLFAPSALGFRTWTGPDMKFGQTVPVAGASSSLSVVTATSGPPYSRASRNTLTLEIATRCASYVVRFILARFLLMPRECDCTRWVDAVAGNNISRFPTSIDAPEVASAVDARSGVSGATKDAGISHGRMIQKLGNGMRAELPHDPKRHSRQLRGEQKHEEH